MKAETDTVSEAARKNLPRDAKHLIANARNDITIPYFTGALRPVDDTILTRGGGKGLKIYDEIERDTHAYAMLQKRKKTLLGREWEVAEASDKPEDMRSAEIVRAQLEALPFDRICEDMLDATLKGYAVGEVIWERRDNMIAVRDVVAHDQRRFVFDEEWQPRLLTMTSMRDGIELPTRKFMIHRYGVKGNNPYGLGLGTRLFWATLFKREGVTFWLHFLEKFAGPTVVAETPYGTLTEEQTKLLNTLKQVRTSSALTVPVGTEVKFLEAARSGSVTYEQFLTYWDKQISICVNGETLTTDVGSVGSKAASQTHESILEKLIDSDGDLLSDTLQQNLIQWIVDYNVPGAAAPRVWRVRAQNEREVAETRDKQAKAAEARDKAWRRALNTAAMLEDDEEARSYLVSTGLTGDMPETVLDAFVGVRLNAQPETQNDTTTEPAQFAANRLKKKRHSHACMSEPDSPLMRVADDLEIMCREHFVRRIAAIRAAVDAETPDLASQNLLVLASHWTPDVLGTRIELALELAALWGREDVLAEISGEERDFATEVTPQAFLEQIEFLRQKRGQPTERWTDLMRGGHDRAFAVAGATDAAMIEDFHQAVLRAAETWDRKQFAADFDRIVERYGWSYNGGRTWRIRTIFETNLRTSAMAGRLAQMRDPDVIRTHPFWRYRHGETRVPLEPRPEHVEWDGLVLMHDDAWWDTHFPPNDWRCSCGVRALSRGDLRRMGKDGPDTAPEVIRDPIIDKATGQPSELPRGIGYGWDYQPGTTWERGLVPNAVQADQALKAGAVTFDTPAQISRLRGAARPATAELLSARTSTSDAVAQFLDPFGASLGRAVPFEDKAGTLLSISDQLFRDGAGDIPSDWPDLRWLLLAGEAIRDPDEIWMGLTGTDEEQAQLDRRYVRVNATTGEVFGVLIGHRFWRALRVSGDDATDLLGWRQGKLLWRRRGEE